MKALVVGAGAVGRVLGLALHRGGMNVSWLVRPAHLTALRGGIAVRSLNTGRIEQLALPELVTEPIMADLVVLAVPSTALDPAWLRRIALAAPHAPVVVVQPGLDDSAKVAGAFGPFRIVRGLFPLLARSGGATDREPVELWRPPFVRLPLAGQHAAEVARYLIAGGLPARVVEDVEIELAKTACWLDPLSAALVCAGGRMADLRRDAGLFSLAIAAAEEATRWVSAQHQMRVRAPAAWLIEAALFALPKLASFDVESILAAHYTKLRRQTTEAISSWQTRVVASGGRADALTTLGERLAGPCRPLPGALTFDASRKLARRAPLLVDASRPIAIKRNVHEFVVACDASVFAETLNRVLLDPERAFGRLRIKRDLGVLGSPFAKGERFQGVLSLFPSTSPVLLRRLEEELGSDFAEIVEWSPTEVVYRYLEGSPMAGQSTLRVVSLGPNCCRFEAIFEYQEISDLAIQIMQRFALRLHDDVVAEQVDVVAKQLGVRVVSATLVGVTPRGNDVGTALRA